MKLDFGLSDPKIAVSSLNPHSGEEGKIGNEEIKIIKPTIDKFVKQGNKINGPKSADTMFHKEALKNIDANLCMFHDQALIPIKSSDFYGSINDNTKALELNPNRLDAYQNRGKAKLALGDKIGACADFKKGASKGNKQLVEFLNSWRGGWCQKM